MNNNSHDESDSYIPTELEAGSPEMTMAPLIDVVFLLLIFFVVTTVFPENKGLVISKPNSENTKQLAPKQLKFLVNKKDEIFFKDNKVDLTDIKRIVQENILIKPDVSILLKVDKESTTGMFVKLMDACKAGGASNIGIATDALKNP